jgi:non-ribosomal peptide synthetase component F
LIAAQQQSFDVTPGDRVLQFAAQSFDAAVWETLSTLYAGGALQLTMSEQRTNLADLTRLIYKRGIAIAFLPPALLSELAQASLTSLRTIVTGAEAVRGDLVARFAPGRRFINAYGPTETTVCATLSTPLDPLRDSRGTPPIGSPIWNTQIHILSAALQPVPIGVWGELYIAGAGLARGPI